MSTQRRHSDHTQMTVSTQSQHRRHSDHTQTTQYPHSVKHSVDGLLLLVFTNISKYPLGSSCRSSEYANGFLILSPVYSLHSLLSAFHAPQCSVIKQVSHSAMCSEARVLSLHKGLIQLGRDIQLKIHKWDLNSTNTNSKHELRSTNTNQRS